MTYNSTNPLTPAEWKVMKIAWERKSGASRDFCKVCADLYGWAPSTVKTVLARLVEKGFLKTTQVGNSFLYEPNRPALKTLYSAADFLLGNTLEGTTGPLLSYMVKKSWLSEEEIDELQAMLDKHKAKKEK